MSQIDSIAFHDARYPYAYTHYGQHLHSNEPLPLLSASKKEAAKVTITFLPPEAHPSLDNATLRYAYPVIIKGQSMMQLHELPRTTGLYYWLRMWADGLWGDCLLRADGSAMEVLESDPAVRHKIMSMLLGNATSLLLRLQGFTTLHASALLIDGGVVAFTGVTTTGKSTTLAALLQHGADFFSDDLVPLVSHAQQTFAYPGHPRVGLWPDAMVKLFGPTADLPLIQHGDKRAYIPPIIQDPTRPWPIRAVYLLGPRGADPTLTKVAIVPLSQAEAVAALMSHTTGRMLRTDIEHVNDLAHIAALVRNAPVRRVDRPDDLSQLDAITQAILLDVKMLAEKNHS